MNKNSVGQILKALGAVDDAQIQKALDYAGSNDCRIGEALVRTGACDQRTVSRALAKHWRVPFANLSKGEIKKECGETFTDVTQMVMDDDPVYFIAIEPSNPAIDIEKTVNGIDADNPPGPEFQVGDKVTIEYVVTNTGDVKLSNIVVTDSDLGVRNCELTMLEVGESMSCDMFMETLTEPGAVFMKATVTGDGPDGTEVMDMDPIHFTVVETLPPPEVCSVELLPISVGEGLVQVSWSPVDRAVEYIVRRDGVNVGVTSDTSLIDGPIPPNRTFTYKVQSVAADGTRSDKAFCGRVIYIPAD